MDTETTSTALPSAHDVATAAFADSSSAPPDATTETQPTATAAATVQPEPTTDTPGSEGTTPQVATGEPPKWRWQDILANARAESAREAEARLRQELAWAQEIAPEHRSMAPKAIQFAAWLEADPQAATDWLVQQVQSRGGTRPSADAKPEPDRQAEDGTLLYSAAQLEKLRAWDERRLLRQMEQQLKPFQEDRAARQQEAAKQQLRSTVQSRLASLRQRPHFTEHEPAIKAAMVADATLSVEEAYAQVLTETVIPSLASRQEKATLSSLKTRAVAGTVNPSSATGQTPGSVLGNARAAAEAAFRD